MTSLSRVPRVVAALALVLALAGAMDLLAANVAQAHGPGQRHNERQHGDETRYTNH